MNFVEGRSVPESEWYLNEPVVWGPLHVRVHVHGDHIWSRVESESGSSDILPETTETLVDLAKQNNREDFVWLARSAGVAEERLEALWDGTRKRVTVPPLVVGSNKGD